jgi:hypothetical protein
MPGGQLARGLACKSKNAHEQVTTGPPNNPALPARLVLTVSFVLSPAIGLFVTVASAMRQHRRQLDLSVERTGRHDFTVRDKPARLAG